MESLFSLESLFSMESLFSLPTSTLGAPGKDKAQEADQAFAGSKKRSGAKSNEKIALS